MAESSFPPAKIVPPLALNHEMTVILLHGRGSNAAEFKVDFFDTQSTSDKSLFELFPSIKWVFPDAKDRHSTIFRSKLCEWYDVWSLTDPDERKDLSVDGLVESIKHIRTIVDEERRILLQEHPDEDNVGRRIVLGGISMGCAVSVHTLLSSIVDGSSVTFAGFFGWCGWMPFTTAIKKEIDQGPDLETALLRFYQHILPVLDGNQQHEKSQALSPVPVFLSHCLDDSVVSASLGANMKRTLTEMGIAVHWKGYVVGEHWIKAPEEIDRMAIFLGERIDALEAGT